MRSVLFFVCALAISLLGATDKKLTDQFELLVKQSNGVLTDFPEDVRELRKGPVVQRVLFDDHGDITIRLTFPCAKDDGSVAEAQFSRTIHLADLRTNQGAVILNEHLNTITFKQPIGVCNVAFSDLQKACCAKKILDELIANAVPVEEEKMFLASDLVKEAKYTYLVVAPRNGVLPEAARGVFMNGSSAQNVVWLTKRSLDDVEGIIREGCNCLPLFIYDVRVLDKVPFYTTSIRGSTSLTSISFNGFPQSVFSKDEQALRLFVSSAPFVGIRFKEDPCLGKPICVLCKKAEKAVIRKVANEQHIKISDNDFKISAGLLGDIDITVGTTQYWLTGINNNSYEIVAYCLQSERFSHDLFSGILYRELPHLRPLLRLKSRYAKNMTREQAICRSLNQLAFLKNSLRPDLYAVLQIALFSCELGASFGNDADVGYNSWPFALTLSEKVGFSGIQEQMLEFLVCGNALLVINKHEKARSVFETWHCLAQKAGSLGIPAEDLWILKKTFAKILLNGDCQHVSSMHLLDKVHKSFGNILCFGVPFGLRGCRGPYPLRSVYSSYIWEVRDRKHRDGLILNRKRAKFEAMMLQGIKSGGKSFWEWLDRVTVLPSTTYVPEAKKEAYRAVFENGRLIHPVELSDCDRCEVLFVIDDWGRIYVGLKEDAVDATKCSFNHASLFNGNPAASAGKLILERGVPVEILDHSGHYRPTMPQIEIAVKSLAEHKVDIEHLVVNMKIAKRKWTSGTEFIRFSEGQTGS